MMSNKTRILLLRDIEDGFSKSLPTIIALCKRSGDLNLFPGNIKSGMLKIRHAYMPEISVIEHTPENLITGGYKSLPAELEGQADYAENNIIALIEAISEEYRRLTKNGMPEEKLELHLAMLMKNIHDIGVVDNRVWEWQREALLRRVDNQITHSLDPFDEGSEIIFAGNPGRPVNLTKAESLTSGVFVQIINPSATLSKVKHVDLERPSGLFLATSTNPYHEFSSIADMVVEMVDGKIVRVEVKAWHNMTFEFDANGLPVIRQLTENSLLQGYRYLFESVFRHNDMTTLSYAIPSKTGAKGIKPDHVRKMLEGLMDPKSKDLLKNLVGTGGNSKLNFPDNLTGRDQLAARAFEAALAEDDVTILNIMKKWDGLLAQSPNDFPGCRSFADATSGTSVDNAFQALGDSLQKHLDTPAKTFGTGILLVDSLEE